MTVRTTGRSDLLRAVRSVVDGPVLTEGDGYDRARTPYFEHERGHPIGVIRPRDAGDIAATVDIARGFGVDLVVRGGGHGLNNTGDGLLLDLGTLDGVELDLSSHALWAGAGLTGRSLSVALSGHGLAVGLGDTGSVGIGGLTLGGGVGYLSRRDGLTIDNVLAAEIVTADGRVQTVDRDHEPELFWALRGGGGNFGIVTRFRYRAVPTDQVYAGDLVLPADPATIVQLLTTLTRAPETLSAIVNIMPAPPLPGLPGSLAGTVVVMMRVCYSGALAEADQTLAPLRDIAPAYADVVGPTHYSRLFDRDAPSRGARVATRTLFVDGVDHAAAAAILGHLERPGPMLRLVQFRVLGGAISRVPEEATAYAHRAEQIMTTVVHAGRPRRSTALRWVRAVAAELSPGPTGSYVNFIDPSEAQRPEVAYPGEVLARLRDAKAAYDPGNLFSGTVTIWA
jgi:FAD/FMN-containing dehydrogenase